MASLMALLAQQGSGLTTRKGLILLGLQNDFLSTEGKLPVSTQSGFVDHLKQLVPAFRQFGDVIWVLSEFEANRALHDADENGDTVIAGSFARVDDSKPIKKGAKRGAGNDTSAPLKRMKATEAEDDPELFLTRTSTREPCCLRGSWGVEHPADVAALVDTKDLQVVKTYYSAFRSTSLLATLRGRLITELYVCGCNTNLSVFATAMDAARYGIKITLVEDCLGFRSLNRHDEAVRQLVHIMEADVLTSQKVIETLKNPPIDDSDGDDDEESEDEAGEEEERLAQNLARTNVSQMPSAARYGSAPSGPELAGVLAADSDEDDEDEDEHEMPFPTNSIEALSDLVPNAPSDTPPLAQPTVVEPHAVGAPNALDSVEQRSTTPTPAQEASVNDMPLLGHGKDAESAGSRIRYNLLPPELAKTVFEQINNEVHWQRMHHQTGEVPRLVCCQGTVADHGSKPVYRHPSDQTLPLQPWSPTVDVVRKAAEVAVGHPLNHALIQLYRSGADCISEHSDKTLDIAKGSSIVNVSFGAQRTMRLRSKRMVSTAPSDTATAVPPPARRTHRIPMPDNSILIMSLPTNAEYLHSINPDKRPAAELTAVEKACGGQRISLTFRHIATFLSADEDRIWGQGAIGKDREGARGVVNGDAGENGRLLRAFAAENAAGGVEWGSVCGEGSDVLHLGPRADVAPTEELGG
ncbi:hypothetical protein LTR53_015997 [Teratosphaeriaceae sp. CCFEE 6253]|nr:hypothetical protein LTR53_015997 [Teratosphaeriaceae sp. CCFEE 6253]